jgi:beta-glucosidase
MMNMARNALHGRNWEGFGADPYLAGENAFYYVQGIQNQGVVATAKHYICNEQETNRLFGAGVNEDVYSANVDDKTIHEIYLWPFATSVAAGAGSIMCSYNKLNGTAACQNSKSLNDLLKGELGFQGNVMSDWGATKTGVESALGGLDVEMPGGDGYLGYSLLQAVQSGQLNESRINDMVIRLLAPYYLLGQDQGFPPNDNSHDGTEDHYRFNRIAAAAGMVLLKNVNNYLPLNISYNRHMSVFGAAAGQDRLGLYPAYGAVGVDGAIYQGGGSGSVRPTYGIDPLSSLILKAREAHFQIQYVIDQNNYQAVVDSFSTPGFSAPICLVFINAYSSEGYDRTNLHAYHDGDVLVLVVASRCASIIVIVNSVSHLNLEAWIDNPNVVAVIWSGLPGPEYGPALVDVLFGNYNPGGKLVFTIAKNDTDFGTSISTNLQSNYTEGVFLDYRHFDKYNIAPRYYFGYGLSYTTFALSSLVVSKVPKNKRHIGSTIRRHRASFSTAAGDSELYDSAYTAAFSLTNTGNVYGSEVPQLYLGFPDEAAEPPKVLRGFERVYLDPGESKIVSLTLTQKDISYWNVVNQTWTVARGNYTVWIGTSANPSDLKLQSYFNV